MPGVKGKSGPRYKPKVLKELQGTLRDDRHPANEPEFEPLAKAPRCPTKLTGEARKVWKHLGGLLAGTRVLTEVDLHGLEAYCVIYARWVDAEANLAKYGVMMSDDGKLFPSPYLRIAEDSLKQMRSWMMEFGITPASRSRVSVDKKATPDAPASRDWFNDNRN